MDVTAWDGERKIERDKDVEKHRKGEEMDEGERRQT